MEEAERHGVLKDTKHRLFVALKQLRGIDAQKLRAADIWAWDALDDALRHLGQLDEIVGLDHEVREAAED